METIENSVVITTNVDKRIRVSLDADSVGTEGWSKTSKVSDILLIKDKDNGKLISTNKNPDGSVVINENGYPELSFRLECEIVPESQSVSGKAFVLDKMIIKDGEYDFIFGTFLGSNMCFLNDGRERVLLSNVERFGFEGKYEFASGRGYIWSCTIPLLKKALFLGVGQDNLVYEYPNSDYVGKVYAGFEHLFVTKPHNMFLGIWVQQGLLALLAFLFLYALFMIRAIRLCYGKHKVASSPGFNAKGVVIMTAVGTSAYMVAGLANDTVVGVAHLYWILLGIGYAAESICRRKNADHSEEWVETKGKSSLIPDEDNIAPLPSDPEI